MHAGAQHVVVADDDEDLSEVVQATLESAGYDVVAVTSGADVLAYLTRARGCCVVLLDLCMIDMNGWEVLSALRSANSAEHRVVVMSGVAEHQLPHGVPLLRKPFTAEQLLGVVRSHARN